MSKLETMKNKQTHIQDIDYHIFSGTKWNKRGMRETQMEKEQKGIGTGGERARTGLWRRRLRRSGT